MPISEEPTARENTFPPDLKRRILKRVMAYDIHAYAMEYDAGGEVQVDDSTRIFVEDAGNGILADIIELIENA